MSLIYSNYPPLKTKSETYHEAFIELLGKSDSVNIASGYISADALIDLKSIVEEHGGPRIHLSIGMHYFDGLTRQQKEAVENLDNTLRTLNLGEIDFVITFPFHGKIISFKNKNQIIGGLIGSSNLTNIAEDRSNRQYEVDYRLPESELNQLDEFINQLRKTSTRPFKEIEIKIIESNNLLDEQYGVQKANYSFVNTIRNSSEFEYQFQIPLKTDDATRSNLNTFNGKGRENKQGFVMPRSWYEVELIVPAHILRQDGFPLKGNSGESIEIITDDGWSFKCESNGQNGKNFRSQGDLKILGKWLKGRLEFSGALKTGDLCTQLTLDKYGRSSFTLAKIKNMDLWYLDFGVTKL